MADITPTAAQIIPDTSGVIKWGTAGAAATVGQWVYYAANTNKWNLADADALATVKEGENVGVVVAAAAAANQKIAVQTTGSPTLGAGAAPAAGQEYSISTTAGAIAPSADIGAGDFNCVVGIGSGTNQITLGAHGAILGQTAHA